MLEGLIVIKRMKKNVVLLLTMTLLLSLIQVPERALAQDALDINAGAAILVEASTGKILYAKNEDTALGIASMTKMMSEYLLFEAISDKENYMGSGADNQRICPSGFH